MQKLEKVLERATEAVCIQYAFKPREVYTNAMQTSKHEKGFTIKVI